MSRSGEFWAGSTHRDLVHAFIEKHSEKGLADEINNGSWLHGTSPDSAKNIVERGLNFDAFAPEQANNIYGPGFYVTRSPDVASEYALSHRHGGDPFSQLTRHEQHRVVEGEAAVKRPVRARWDDLLHLGNQVKHAASSADVDPFDEESNKVTGRRTNGALRALRRGHPLMGVHVANLSLRQFGVDFIHDPKFSTTGDGAAADAGIVLHKTRFRPVRTKTVAEINKPRTGSQSA